MPMIVSQGLVMTRILLLGGTAEASRLARLLADAQADAVFSYAGRTEAPRAQPLPQRVGGFGGVDGLARYLVEADIGQVVDATHPFAAQISHNAFLACQRTAIPLLRLARPAWRPEAGDRWHDVAGFASAAAALPDSGARVFLAIGRQNLAAFANDANRYLLRLVDMPGDGLPLAQADIVIARGPFSVKEDLDLMIRHGITHVVAKNAGGTGACAKLIAARKLRLPVVMIQRPNLPACPTFDRPEDVMASLHQSARACRGV